MAFDKPYLNKSNPYQQIGSANVITRTIYYGEVVSVDDPTDGGRIKVKINDLDHRTSVIDELPWCYPLIPKFFHIYPQVGEMVRILIEDIKYPQKSRYWVGSIISQLQKIKFDQRITALSTTNWALTPPEQAPSTYPDADGVFPLKTDVALIGRNNTDVILSDNNVNLRAGKHVSDNILKLNTSNPAQISLNFDVNTTTGEYHSNNILMADKIALISHEGTPKYKGARLTADDRTDIFNTAHPIARGDVLVEALNVIRKALINHIHGYSGLGADKNDVIKDLENIDLEGILQKNVVVN
jgi:hypothetical protein